VHFAAAVVIAASFQANEQSNANVQVIPFGLRTDPQVIACAPLRMIE
jgi:hypothetical protein